MPEEYLDGYVIFMGRRFNVDRRALIPRFETEELVKYCLTLLQSFPQITTCIDVGTGSGIIPIALYQHLDRPMTFYATDSSPDALELAQENATALCADDVIFLSGDLLAPVLDRALGDHVLMTANLPYVREKDIQGELTYEPHIAFMGGEKTGFELYERFFDELFSWH